MRFFRQAHKGQFRRTVVVTVAAGAVAMGALTATAQAATSPTAAAAGPAAAQSGNDMLLVHGYNSDEGTDCNGSTWGNALEYYTDEGGLSRDSLHTIGYYKDDMSGENDCDVMIGDGQATTDRKIQYVARDLANYVYQNYTSRDQAVDIVAHSMGGLVTRVAILGSYEGWSGFPPALNVDNVATLATPHQGVICDDDTGDGEDNCPNTEQWLQMDPDSGFMDALHQSDRELNDPWAAQTDWSLIGSDEDTTVSYDSAIDKGNYADQKYGYNDYLGDSHRDCWTPEVSHSAIRTLTGAGGYCMYFWHASGDHSAHKTTDGWSPLKTAYKAARYDGDDLPR